MSKKLNYLLAFALLCSVIFHFHTGQKVDANQIYTTAQAGSALDPIITKSYLEKRLVEVEDSLKREMSKAAAQGNEGGETQSDHFKFIVIELKKDAKLIFGESTEFILRSGNALVFDKTTNGISDLTDGDTKFNEMQVQKDHHMLNPRNDGRGIVAKSDCFVLVKGEYKITE